MKNIIVTIIAIIAAVIVGVFIFNTKNNKIEKLDLIKNDAEILLYKIGKDFTGSAFVSLKFKSESRGMLANVFADLNEDGIFETEKEWIVKNTRVNIKPDFPNRISFKIDGADIADKNSIDVRVMLSSEIINNSENANEEKIIPATIRIIDSSEQLGIDVPGASIELKRGTPFWSVATAQSDSQATEEPLDIQLDELPDLAGGPMDCFPIATANNLIYLTNKNGKRNDIPAKPEDIIKELKTDMKYNNGVLLRNFEAGKQAFIERYNLPIETKRIDKPSFDDIKNAIESGGVVELSTGMTQSRSGRANTGHVMAVAGVIADGGQVGFTASDPATPVGGAEIFELIPPPEGSDVWTFNYPLWDGITFIDAIFIQTWKTDNATSAVSAENNQTLTGNEIPFGEGTKDVEVLVLDGKNYPKFQFHKADPDACKAKHWHAGGKVVNLKEPYAPKSDPDSSRCGFGKVGEVPEKTVKVTEAEASKFFGEYLIQNP